MRSHLWVCRDSFWHVSHTQLHWPGFFADAAFWDGLAGKNSQKYKINSQKWKFSKVQNKFSKVGILNKLKCCLLGRACWCKFWKVQILQRTNFQKWNAACSRVKILRSMLTHESVTYEWLMSYSYSVMAHSRMRHGTLVEDSCRTPDVWLMSHLWVLYARIEWVMAHSWVQLGVWRISLEHQRDFKMQLLQYFSTSDDKSN